MRSYVDWVREAEEKGLKIGELVLLDQTQQLGKSADELYAQMRRNLKVMREAVEIGLSGKMRSLSGLIGGQAVMVEARGTLGKSLVGEVISKAMARALAVSEVNATMGKIVAAPTAGSCGVLPGVLLTVEETCQVGEENLLKGLFTAAGVGMVIADRANVSGAEGGCQAEIGSAAAMAAAAAVEMAGGTPEQTGHAAALALKSFLGLVCDPVAGLVEIPCVKRNAIAAVHALAAAELALSGVKSAIPLDEVIDAMALIGKTIPCALRETAQGGLAITPMGKKIQADFYGS